MDAASRQSDTPVPVLWLLHGPKAGDNAQMRALADAAAARRSLDVQVRRLSFHAGELLVTLAGRPSLAGLDRRRSDVLAPPWPDLVVTAGRRNEPVARWIQRASGGRTRVVHLGRPWADPRRYDLVVTTPQYFLDETGPGRILVLDLPPVAAPEPRAREDGDLALLVGGDSGSQVLRPRAAAELARRTLSLARALDRDLRVTTSPRTPPAAEAHLLAALAGEPGVRVHAWHRDANADNPYRDWLAEAGAFVVTGDSISMIAEAASTGRPLWIAPLSRSRQPWWLTRHGWRWKSATHELAQRLAPRRFRRDTRRLLRALVDSGRAAWLEEGVDARFTGLDSVTDDIARARDALLELLPPTPD